MHKLFSCHRGYLTFVLSVSSQENNKIEFTYYIYDEAKKRARNPKTVRGKGKPLVESPCAQPKTIRHHNTNKSFRSSPSLSLRPKSMVCNLSGFNAITAKPMGCEDIMSNYQIQEPMNADSQIEY